MAGFIYKISCLDENVGECYVGSTENFRVRKNNHKTMCMNPRNKNYNWFLYRFIRDHGGWENWKMEIVDQILFEDCKELHHLENDWIKKLDAQLNKQSAPLYDSKKDYYQANKDRIQTYNKKWEEDNKEHRREYHKKMKEQNKEHNKQLKKEWDAKNKEHIKEYEREKVICPICEKKMNRSSLRRHKKIHQELPQP